MNGSATLIVYLDALTGGGGVMDVDWAWFLVYQCMYDSGKRRGNARYKKDSQLGRETERLE